MGSSIFAIAWLGLAKTEEVVRVSGKLEPKGSVQKIQMPLGGIASDILVEDGEEVKAGQVLMKLDAEVTRQRLSSLKESQRLKSKQLDLKLSELDKYVLLNEQQALMLEEKIKLELEILESLKYLFDMGAGSKLQYIQQLNQLNEIQGELKSTKLELLRQKALQNQQIQQLKAELGGVK